MDFLDKLGKTANKTYRYTANKTSKLAKEAKLRFAMSDNKDQIEDLYREIGKIVYKNHISEKGEDIDVGAIVQEECIQIDEICDRIEDQRKELLALKEKKQCPNCFYEMTMDCHYCPNCGEHQEDPIVEEEEETTMVDQTNAQQNEKKEEGREE